MTEQLPNENEAKSKLIDQWLALRIYLSAASLSAGGNKVHLMYWNEKSLLENLGSGTVDLAATLLANDKALQMYGSVMDSDLSELLQCLFHKFIYGKALKLHTNEIQGTDAFDWKPYPKALIVENGKIHCDQIEDRLTEVKGLLDFMVTDRVSK